MKSKNNKKYKWKIIIDQATNLLIKNGFQIAYCTDRRYLKRYIRKNLISKSKDKRFCYNYKISSYGYIRTNKKTIVWFIITYKPNNDEKTCGDVVYYHENNETNLFTVYKNN